MDCKQKIVEKKVALAPVGAIDSANSVNVSTPARRQQVPSGSLF